MLTPQCKKIINKIEKIIQEFYMNAHLTDCLGLEYSLLALGEIMLT